MRRQRRRARRLVQIEGVAAGQDGQVDGLAYLLGQRPADRPALLHHVQSPADRPGQTHDAEPEPELAACRVLGYEFPAVERSKERIKPHGYVLL